jgi:hypothetical protein
MMGARALERIDEKLAMFEAALRTALPTRRTIEAGFVPMSERDKTQLLDGVVNVVCDGEGSYSQAGGMAAREGTAKVVLICHLQVEDEQRGEVLRQAEIDLAEEIKAFTRSGVTGMDVVLVDLLLSRQLEHPYGWGVAYFELRPPGAGTH